MYNKLHEWADGFHAVLYLSQTGMVILIPNNRKEVFTNTRKSTSVRQFMFGLLPIICIEFIVVGVLIYFFVPRG